uniref:DekiORF133 n=1 Tax=Dendrolimus kikuchii nucleopolyhedrovirus TaxID=1219875 RepID=V9LT12_9ABAC|nr:DekiORF133 [Dendrolimus kikuchii nucleopolyhedrovirus]
MIRLIDQLKCGALPYITTKSIEDRFRDRVMARVDASFYKDCLEKLITNANGGLFVLTGGAATACHIDDGGDAVEHYALKCLDLQYYHESGAAALQLGRIERSLQESVNVFRDKIAALLSAVKLQDGLVVYKCYQNGAFQLNGDVALHLNARIQCTQTEYNDQFDLVRFALQVEVTGGVTEYRNQRIVSNATLSLSVFFVNILVMKHEFDGDRCIKIFRPFGVGYRVLVAPLQRVLNDQLVCLLKDIFTRKFEYKIAHRLERIKRLYLKLPHHYYEVCINDQSDNVYRHRHESVTCFVKRILDRHGPALGCRILMHTFLTTDSFDGAVPTCVGDEINCPYVDSVDVGWKRFMSCILMLY